MVFDGDINQAKDLLKPAKRVIEKGSSIVNEDFERRVQLWNEIKQNMEKYEDGECGNIINDLDRFYRASFEFALLTLARSFIDNEEEFPPADKFNDDEIIITRKLEKYNVFEIYSQKDIKKKVISKDQNLLDLFKEYYVFMDKWVENTIEKPEISLNIRYYLKKKWGEYKIKIEDAINTLIKDVDWFSLFIREVTTPKAEAEITTQQVEPEVVEEPPTVEDDLRGPRFIEIGEAKFYEHNFIGRTKNKLQGNLLINGGKYKLENLQEHSNIDVSKYVSAIDDQKIKNLPLNKYIAAELRLKKLFGSKSMNLKAVYASRVDKYAYLGIDTYPLDLTDINPYLDDAMQQAGNNQILMCIASPTGFSKEVEEHINGEELYRNFLSANVSVCLVDLVTGKLIFNPYDKISKDFKNIFALEIDEEKVALAKRRIEEELISTSGVLLNDFIRKYGDKKQIVKKAFLDLAEEKGYQVEYRREYKTSVLFKR